MFADGINVQREGEGNINVIFAEFQLAHPCATWFDTP